MRTVWIRTAVIASSAAFFAGLAFDLTIPLFMVTVMGLVDRVLVTLFMVDAPAMVGEGEQPA